MRERQKELWVSKSPILLRIDVFIPAEKVMEYHGIPHPLANVLNHKTSINVHKHP